MKSDFISRSKAKKLGATCLARRNENGQLEAIISLDYAPTVDIKDELAGAYNEGYMCGSREAEKALKERPKDYDSNEDIIPMGCKEEKEDVFTRKEELSKEESEWLIDFITKKGDAK